ncbi:MAG: AAA family ATPase [Lachnospiraceae bacterium]|nr:AAA family ATPase [Lachnospiraceae bacterium]
MKITKLAVSDFGKFHQKEFRLSPGLNIATGANESGKSTLHRFIRSMFYGLERERGIKARKDDYIRLKPWEHGRFQGFMEFTAEGKEYRLFRNFLTTEKQVILTDLSTGREADDPAKALRDFGLKSEAVYTNTFCVGNSCGTEELLGAELKDYLANLSYGGGTGLNLQKSLGWLAARKKEVLKQIPEKELADYREVLLTKEGLEEQLDRTGHRMEAYLRHQKELEDEIKATKKLSEQVALERGQAEEEERKKFRGERLLLLGCVLAAGLCGASFFLPALLFRVTGWVVSLSVLLTGFFLGIPSVNRGRDAGIRKQELEEQLLQISKQMEGYYEKLTLLLPEMEQEKFRMEQTEEQLKRCELAKERYEELKRQQQTLLLEAEALTLAYTTLEQLSVELYEEFGAKFADALSEYAKAFTDHSYELLTAEEDMVLKAVTEARNLEVSDVSFGTGEQFYLALRFAAADVFDPEKKNPVILDDSFAAFDDQRLESAILALAKCGRQILIFSSTGREEAAAKRMGITYEAVF